MIGLTTNENVRFLWHNRQAHGSECIFKEIDDVVRLIDEFAVVPCGYLYFHIIREETELCIVESLRLETLKDFMNLRRSNGYVPVSSAFLIGEMMRESITDSCRSERNGRNLLL